MMSELQQATKLLFAWPLGYKSQERINNVISSVKNLALHTVFTKTQLYTSIALELKCLAHIGHPNLRKVIRSLFLLLLCVKSILGHLMGRVQRQFVLFTF
jgi:hypothetical protein